MIILVAVSPSYNHVILIQVYGLSWVEKRVASSLFGAPPSATVDEALESFLKVNIILFYSQRI